MVLGEQFALHLEQAFRVTQVTHQVTGDFGQLVILAGEDLLPRLDHRVGLIPHIQVHGTVVCVHSGLDRITDIVGLLRTQAGHRRRRHRGGVLGGIAEIGHLRIRVGVGGGVAIDDPLDAAIDHGWIHATVKCQVRRDLGHTFLRGTVVENLGFAGHTVGEQNLVRTEADCIENPGEQVADRRSAIALERGQSAFGTGRVIEFPSLRAFRCADNRVFGGVRREVDAWLVLFGLGELALGGDARFKEFGLAVGSHLVAVSGHHAITMGVHGVVVDPVAVVVASQVKLTRGDHGVLGDAINLILIDGKRVGEGVVLLGLLQLLERGADDLRVEQTNLRGGVGLLGQCTLLALVGHLVLLGFELVETVGGASGVDVALDIGGFHLLRVRVDAEALQQYGPSDGEHHADHYGSGNGNDRHTPGFERSRGAHTDGRLAFKRMGLHQPYAQHHAKDGGQCGHDEGDGNVGMHCGIGSASDTRTLYRELIEDAQHLSGRPRKHVKDQPDAELTASAFGDGEQATAVDRHGDADAAHQHMRDQ